MPRPTASAPTDARSGDRIAKLLARAGVASRRDVERMIAEGRVALDGTVVATPATVLPSLAGVTVDGQPVAAPEPARLFLYHKPTGLLVTERDPRGRPTIYDRLSRDLPRVVPVGRLDLNTEGLLLLTTDGGLKRQLELPASGVERTYRARVYGRVGQEQLEELIDGVEIDGVRYGAIDANLERRTGANAWIELTLTEGKNREVRRVLEHLGLEVGRLIRTRYGPFVLGDLPAGEVGEVRQADLAGFRQALTARRPEAGVRAERQPRTPGERSTPAPGYTPIGAERTQRRAQAAATARAKPSPGEGRSPAAAGSVRGRTARPFSSATQKSNGERARAATGEPKPGARIRRGSTTSGAKTSTSPASSEAADMPTRPAKLQRKPGWAKPKPKTGPRGPKKR